jgi:RNA polymerase sigma factor (sigma-70 family)
VPVSLVQWGILAPAHGVFDFRRPSVSSSDGGFFRPPLEGPMACDGVGSARLHSCLPVVDRLPDAVARLRALSPREIDYEVYVTPVRRAVKSVARRHRLSASQAEDLQSELWVRLLSEQGRALRDFKGQAKVETYLVAVAHNLTLDARRRLFGKWRPSVAAVRSGAVAMQLERLIVRDGMTYDAAVEWFATAHPHVSRSELDRLARSIVRRTRRCHVGDAPLEGCQALGPSPYESVRSGEQATRATQLSDALTTALNACSQADRQMLTWRYVQGRSVREIADDLAVEPRWLYRRFEQLLRQLRRRLATLGFGTELVLDVLDSQAASMSLMVPLAPAGAVLDKSA